MLLFPQERMSLKHQNKGKWARSRAIMAKYDLEVRWSHRRVWWEATLKLIQFHRHAMVRDTFH